MKKKIDRIFFLASVGIMAFSANAQADIIIYDRLEGGSGNVRNILFNNDGRDDVSLVVDGFFNQAEQMVNYTGAEPLRTASGRQARIGDVAGTFDFISFQYTDPTFGFNKVQFNIDAVNDGFVNRTFTDRFGTAWTDNSPYAVDGAGENWFSARGISGQVISAVAIESSVDLATLADLARVRMNVVPVANGVVPEPATMVLLGAGMVGLGFLGSKRRKK